MLVSLAGYIALVVVGARLVAYLAKYFRYVCMSVFVYPVCQEPSVCQQAGGMGSSNRGY